MNTTAADDARRHQIEAGETALGIEFGSTRIKAVLIGADHTPLASGGHSWENQLVDSRWSYDLGAVWEGLQDAYASLVEDVEDRYGVRPTTFGSIGISAMMHGYLASDAGGELLVPFRTWRNTSTGPASEALTDLFQVNVPQRWSIAHLYQAVLDGEPHVPHIASLTTLSGLVHERLTGRHVLGVGDASGMFPIDSSTADYDDARIEQFDALVGDRHLPWTLRDLLPMVLTAGEDAGALTPAGAALLDPTGALRPGIPLCPPEGDAGTGMVATNAVAPRTGNVSAGTSIFAMVVLEEALKQVHVELDPVTTPDGSPVAMVHSNNGASEIDDWVGLFVTFARLAGLEITTPQVYDLLYLHAMEGAPDGGGLLAYNFLSGEPIVGLEEGRPLFTHTPEAEFTLANAMRTQLMTIFASLRIGMDILLEEGVGLDRLFAHGGIFKTPGVAQQVLADALGTPVAVGATAGEGGAWGIAVLARYLVAKDPGQSLPDYLDTRVFADADISVLAPSEDGRTGFDTFMARYRRGLPIALAATRNS